MGPIRYTAVLWDMDGTLADSEPLHQRTLEAVLASVGVDAGPELFEATVGLAELDVYTHCAKRFALAIGQADWIGFRNAAYAIEAASLASRPGALEALRSLAATGISQAIVSNSSRTVLDISLRALDLQALVPVSVSRNDVQHGKPDPEPYLRAASLLGIAPRVALVVEDSPIGAASGLAAGMRVLAWPPPGLATGLFPGQCHCVSSPAELAEFLSLNVQGV